MVESEPRRSWRASLAALLLMLLVLGFNLRLAKPFYNWDLVGYVAAVFAFRNASPEAIHRETFRELGARVPGPAYRVIVEASSYRRAVAESPYYLVRQIPIYSVKPAYPALMLLLQEAGMDLVAASILISRLCYLAIGFLLFFWLSTTLPPFQSFLASWIMVSFPFVVNLARFSTPDALSTLLILSSLALFVEKKAVKSSLALLAGSVLARPDNVLLALPMSISVAVFRKDDRWYALGVGIVCGLLQYLVVRWTGSYGWSVLFYHSFVASLVDPGASIPRLSLADYLAVYLKAAHPRHLSQGLMAFIPVNLLALLRTYNRGGFRDDWFQLLILNSLFMLGHWFLFPSPKDRFFVASYLFISVALVKTIGSAQREGRPRPIA